MGANLAWATENRVRLKVSQQPTSSQLLRLLSVAAHAKFARQRKEMPQTRKLWVGGACERVSAFRLSASADRAASCQCFG